MPEQDSNRALLDVGAGLNQLSNLANWELVVMWVNYKPIGDRCRSIYDVDT